MTRGGWRKSSFSSSSQSSCVEVLLTATSTSAGIRDSKNADGPRLALSQPGWSAFLSSVTHPARGRDGELRSNQLP